MLKLRPYKREDTHTILSWCRDERAFYRWSAGVLGDFPITEKEFSFVENLIPFTAYDKTGITGFFTLRRPDPNANELRFGFVIVDPEKRGAGYGKQMILLGIEHAFQLCGAEKVSLGVFEENEAAYCCYKAAGFCDVFLKETESYRILNEEWKCREMVLENKRPQKG